MLIDLVLSRHAAIHEHVSLAAMTMHIAEEHNLVLLVVASDQLFSKENSRMKQATRIRPSSVHIRANEVASVIACNYTIRIQHWDDLEHESFPQELSLFVILL